MDWDLILTVGVLLLLLSLPSFVGGLGEGRLSRIGVLLVVLGAGMASFAVLSRPEGYTLQEIPEAMLRVLARVIN